MKTYTWYEVDDLTIYVSDDTGKFYSVPTIADFYKWCEDRGVKLNIQ